MAELNLDLDGLEETYEALDRLEDRWTGGGRWVVGTGVEYAIYLEFGTRHMDPKPFLRPAVTELQRGVGQFIRANTNTTLEEIDDVEELLRTIAFGLERRIKEIITQKGLVATGTLRASVSALPLADANMLPTAEDVDPVATEDFEVSA